MDQDVTVLAEFTRITLGAPISTLNKWKTAQVSEAFKYYAVWIDKIAGESFPQEDGFIKITRTNLSESLLASFHGIDLLS